MLTNRRWFCRWMYNDQQGYGPTRPWVRLDDIVALTVVGTDLAMAIRREGPCTLSRRELPFWATVLSGRSPDVTRFHRNLIRYASSAEVVPPPPVSLSSLHEAGEWPTLDYLIPPSSPLHKQLADGQREVVVWDERHGHRAVERHARELEEARGALEDRQSRSELRRQRMDELYRKHGIDPDTQLGIDNSE